MTRTVTIGWALALALASVLAGCKDNEESFYIEHMKKIADPPDCKYSTGDGFIPGVTVDLSLRNKDDFFGWFQVTNALMARENYDTLKAESNGIFVEGSEAVVSIGGATVGGSGTSDADNYIAPETTNVLPGLAIPGDLFTSLADSVACPDMSTLIGDVSADLQADGMMSTIPGGDIEATGYGTVRFIGRTQGGTKVQTNDYSFTINFCCGCYIDWTSCDTPCELFCSDTGTEIDVCQFGVNMGGAEVSCQGLMTGAVTTWQGYDVPDGGTGEELVDMDCSDCSG
jgi:hypothetical protein